MVRFFPRTGRTHCGTSFTRQRHDDSGSPLSTTKQSRKPEGFGINPKIFANGSQALQFGIERQGQRHPPPLFFAQTRKRSSLYRAGRDCLPRMIGSMHFSLQFHTCPVLRCIAVCTGMAFVACQMSMATNRPRRVASGTHQRLPCRSGRGSHRRRQALSVCGNGPNIQMRRRAPGAHGWHVGRGTVSARSDRRSAMPDRIHRYWTSVHPSQERHFCF